jgi:hypothetical protein
MCGTDPVTKICQHEVPVCEREIRSAGWEDREADPEEKAKLLAALARGYGAKPDFKPVAGEIRKRVGDRDGFPTMAVLLALLWNAVWANGCGAATGPSGPSRKAVRKC